MHSINYLIHSFARKGLRLISIPVFTYFLSPSEYGVLNIFSSYVDLFAVLLTLNCTVGVGRYYFEKNQTDFAGLVFTSMVVVFSLLGIWAVVFSSNAAYFAELLEIPPNTIHFLIPCTLLIVFSNYILSVFRSSKQSKLIRNFGIQQTYVQFILAVLIMYFLKEEIYMGRIWANTLASIIFGFVAFRHLKPYITASINLKHIKYLLFFSIPLLPAYLSNMILSYFDRIMINYYVDSESAGLYSFAYNIAGLQYMFSNAIMNAWTPKYFELMNDGNKNEHDKQAVSVLKIISAASIGIILFGDILGMAMSNKSYYSGLSLIPIVVLGQYFITITVLYKNGVSFEKKTWLSTIAILTSAVLNVGLNYLFIPKFGMIAAAYTTLAAYICQAIIMIVLAKKYLNVHSINVKLILFPAFFTMVISTLVILLPYLELSISISLILKIALGAFSILVLLKSQINTFLQPNKIS